jgi:hypothetical protein
MQNIDALERDWRDRKLGRPLHREMTFTEAGVVPGRGTILAEFEKKSRARGLAFDGEDARLLSLLTATFATPVAPHVVEKIRRAGEYWCADEKAPAQIHLAFLGLPKIDEVDAYPLFLAGTALEKGVSPSEFARGAGHRKIQSRSAARSSRERPRERAMDFGGEGEAPRQTFVQRIEIRMAGATMSDANPQGIVPGAHHERI